LLARQQHAERLPLVAAARFASEVTAADLEQADAGSPAVEVALRRREQPGTQGGAHGLHVLADRVFESPQPAVPLGKMAGIWLRQEGPGDRLVEPASSGSAPDLAFQCLLRGGGRASDTVCARQGDALDVVEPVNA